MSQVDPFSRPDAGGKPSDLIPPAVVEKTAAPQKMRSRGLAFAEPPVTTDMIHIVSNEGVCCGGVVSMTFPQHPWNVMVTLFHPQPGSPAMGIGLVNHDAKQTPGTWHDPRKCTGERTTPPRVKLG